MTQTGPIAIRCFESFEAAAHLRDDIDALNRLSVRPDPFSTFGFYETFFRHDEYFPAGQGLRLWFLAAFRQGRLIGHVALKQVTRQILGRASRTVSFLVAHDNDRPHVVARPDDLAQVSAAVYAHLLERRSEWCLLEFQQQDAASSLRPALQPELGVDLRGCLLRAWPTLENCTIPVRWDSLPAYFNALAKKFRVNLGRQMRGLLAAGEVELLSSADPASTPALLALLLGIESHSWKSQAQAGINRHPQRLAYFKALLDASQPMRITVQVLLLDGVPVAGLISGAFLNGLYALHVVYDERLNRWAPGSMMLLLGMRQAIAGGYAFFNLMSGFGYYKVRWLAEITETHSTQIYRIGSLPFWRRVLGDGLRRLRATRAHTALRRFNPARRDRSDPPDESHPDRPLEPAPIDLSERTRLAALITEVRAGAQAECLSAAALLAVMPFEAAPGKSGAKPR